MSSMPGITATPRIAPTIADAPSTSPPARAAGATTDVEIDQATQQPLPPRFPWLSRLSQQLEHAARQKPAFPPAPILGDRLDRSV
jgi:hypothetical protein